VIKNYFFFNTILILIKLQSGNITSSHMMKIYYITHRYLLANNLHPQIYTDMYINIIKVYVTAIPDYGLVIFR